MAVNNSTSEFGMLSIKKEPPDADQYRQIEPEVSFGIKSESSSEDYEDGCKLVICESSVEDVVTNDELEVGPVKIEPPNPVVVDTDQTQEEPLIGRWKKKLAGKMSTSSPAKNIEKPDRILRRSTVCSRMGVSSIQKKPKNPKPMKVILKSKNGYCHNVPESICKKIQSISSVQQLSKKHKVVKVILKQKIGSNVNIPERICQECEAVQERCVEQKLSVPEEKPVEVVPTSPKKPVAETEINKLIVQSSKAPSSQNVVKISFMSNVSPNLNVKGIPGRNIIPSKKGFPVSFKLLEASTGKEVDTVEVAALKRILQRPECVRIELPKSKQSQTDFPEVAALSKILHSPKNMKIEVPESIESIIDVAPFDPEEVKLNLSFDGIDSCLKYQMEDVFQFRRIPCILIDKSATILESPSSLELLSTELPESDDELSDDEFNQFVEQRKKTESKLEENEKVISSKNVDEETKVIVEMVSYLKDEKMTNEKDPLALDAAENETEEPLAAIEILPSLKDVEVPIEKDPLALDSSEDEESAEIDVEKVSSSDKDPLVSDPLEEEMGQCEDVWFSQESSASNSSSHHSCLQSPLRLSDIVLNALEENLTLRRTSDEHEGRNSTVRCYEPNLSKRVALETKTTVPNSKQHQIIKINIDRNYLNQVRMTVERKLMMARERQRRWRSKQSEEKLAQLAKEKAKRNARLRKMQKEINKKRKDSEWVETAYDRKRLLQRERTRRWRENKRQMLDEIRKKREREKSRIKKMEKRIIDEIKECFN